MRKSDLGPVLDRRDARQRGPSQMVFGTEVPGSGSAAFNPQTDRPADDVLAILDHFDFLSEAQTLDIVHHNPQRIFPLLRKTGVV